MWLECKEGGIAGKGGVAGERSEDSWCMLCSLLSIFSSSQEQRSQPRVLSSGLTLSHLHFNKWSCIWGDFWSIPSEISSRQPCMWEVSGLDILSCDSSTVSSVEQSLITNILISEKSAKGENEVREDPGPSLWDDQLLLSLKRRWAYRGDRGRTISDLKENLESVVWRKREEVKVTWTTDPQHWLLLG